MTASLGHGFGHDTRLYSDEERDRGTYRDGERLSVTPSLACRPSDGVLGQLARPSDGVTGGRPSSR